MSGETLNQIFFSFLFLSIRKLRRYKAKIAGFTIASLIILYIQGHVELAAEQNFQTKVKKYYANMPRDESAVFPKKPLVKNHIHREVKVKDINENVEKIVHVEQKVEMNINSSIDGKIKIKRENRNEKDKAMDKPKNNQTIKAEKDMTINKPKNNQRMKAFKADKGNKIKADNQNKKLVTLSRT